MKKNFTLILSLALMQAFGQTAVLQVVSSAGASYSNTNMSISWTIGEPVITTLTSANLILTQGFQQNFQQIVLPILSLSANTLTIAAAGNSTATFDITSNVNWIVSSDQSWLSVSSGSGSGNSTITLTATENPNSSIRTANVTVTGTGLTAQTIIVNQDASTGVNEIRSDKTITIFPNPATSKVWFEVKNQQLKGAFIVEVYDITGRKIINEDLGQFASNELKELSITSLYSGIYLVKVKIGGYNSKVIKLIKE